MSTQRPYTVNGIDCVTPCPIDTKQFIGSNYCTGKMPDGYSGGNCPYFISEIDNNENGGTIECKKD